MGTRLIHGTCEPYTLVDILHTKFILNDDYKVEPTPPQKPEIPIQDHLIVGS